MKSYTSKVEPKLTVNVRRASNYGEYCEHDSLTPEIVIDAEQSETAQRAALSHELLHFVLQQSGADELLGGQATEALCKLIENRLYPLWDEAFVTDSQESER